MSYKYYTNDGYALIKNEFSYIWNELRPIVVEKLAWAASLGDRSENADYQYNKMLLRQIDRRVKFISDILKDANTVDISDKSPTKVLFGSYIEIENDEGSIKHVRIVNANEIYGRKGYISNESPMAKALMGLAIDDEANVITPKGKIAWFVNKIAYTYPSWFGDVEEPKYIFSAINDHEKVKELSDEEITEIKRKYLENLAKS